MAQVDPIKDVRERLEQALKVIEDLATEAKPDTQDSWRLKGKSQGVALAIDYLRVFG